MLSLSFRHLRHHWHLNIITLLGVLMGATLAAGMPLYTATIANSAIRDELNETTIAQRNLSLQGKIDPSTIQSVEESLGELILDRRHLSFNQVVAPQRIYRPDGTVDSTNFSDFFLNAWSVDPLESEVILVEGRWPSDTVKPAQSNDRPVIEVAIGSSVHEVIDLGIGDRLQVGWPLVDVEIVGLIEPRNPESDIWFGNTTTPRFHASHFIDPTANSSEIQIGVLMSMRLFETQTSGITEWRYLIDHQQIDSENLSDVYFRLLAFQSQIGSSKEKLQTELIKRLGRIEADQAQAQAGLYLLLVQSLLAIIYTVAIFTQFDIDQAQRTFSTLKGRGFNRNQLTQIVALNSGLLFFGIALPLGFVIALFAINVWNPNDVNIKIAEIPNASWLLGTSVVFICWLTVVITAYVHTGRNLLDWLRQRARLYEAENQSRKIVFELFILAAGGLAYWQMQSSTGLLTDERTNRFFGAGDPILLLSPTLVLLAIGLLALRLMPLLLNGLSNLGGRLRSFLLPISLLRIARDTTTPTRVVLLITFTVALALFSAIINASLNQRQRDVAHYEIGADLRVRLHLDDELANIEAEQLIKLPAVQAASQAVRGDVTVPDGSGSTRLSGRFLAIDPATLSDVSFYPVGLSPFTLETVVSILDKNDRQGVLPIVIGSNSQTSQIKRGDQLVLHIGRSRIDAEVVGTIGSFPTLENNFFVTNLSILETLTDIEDQTLANEHVRELWLEIADGQQEGVVAGVNTLPTDIYALRILGNAVAQTESYQQTLITQETSAALRLNMIVLIVLSGIGFLTIQYFSTLQRLAEFGIMHALGVDQKSWFRLVSLEAFVMLITGIFLGSILGVTLSFMMQPLFKFLLTASIGSETTLNLVFPLFDIVFIFCILLLVYFGAIIILNAVLGRSDFRKQLRMVQE